MGDLSAKWATRVQLPDMHFGFDEISAIIV